VLIAVDFDGTIVEDRYPEVGPPVIFAFETLREMQKNRHNLILWTTRVGEELEAAVNYCKENGVEFYAVNNSYPEEKFNAEEASRKIICDLFISRKNLGGMKSWGEVWQDVRAMEERSLQAQKPKFLLQRILERFKSGRE
jgi:hypothetical protein